MSMLMRNAAMVLERLNPWPSLLAALALAGCASIYPMMPTPVLYTGAQAKPLFTDIPAQSRTPPLDLLFITDRAPATGPNDDGPYTARRSRSMAFGSATIEFGEGVAWDKLVGLSTSTERKPPLELKLGPTKELGRFPPIPYDVVITPTGITRAPGDLETHETAKKGLQAEVERRLAVSPRKEVVLYIHGYSNTFEDAALTMGDVCHFLGREFVCAIFTWPAGGKAGSMFGYQVDRESSEFAAEDLKKAIRMIADTPGLEKIHLIAHSRGTDVLAVAASELSVEAYGIETTLGRRFKVGNVVLLAPDIDIDVAPAKIYRMISDPDLPWGKAPNPRVVIPPNPKGFHLTIYVSPDDKALGASGWLFGSLSRLGRVDASMIRPEDIAQARLLGLFDVIQVRGEDCFICHSYFISNPRVSSDLIAMLRYGLAPNEPGRPLIELSRPFWRVPTSEEASAVVK